MRPALSEVGGVRNWGGQGCGAGGEGRRGGALGGALTVEHDGEERVHGADVVQHVAVLERDAAEEDEEVQAPHHLAEAPEAEVLPHVVVAEVAEARHPDVRGDEDADGVVHFAGLEVVVEEEQDLHPPLPLLRLVAVEEGGLARVGAVAAGGREDAEADEDEHVAVVRLHRGVWLGGGERGTRERWGGERARRRRRHTGAGQRRGSCGDAWLGLCRARLAARREEVRAVAEVEHEEDEAELRPAPVRRILSRLRRRRGHRGATEAALIGTNKHIRARDSIFVAL